MDCLPTRPRCDQAASDLQVWVRIGEVKSDVNLLQLNQLRLYFPCTTQYIIVVVGEVKHFKAHPGESILGLFGSPHR